MRCAERGGSSVANSRHLDPMVFFAVYAGRFQVVVEKEMNKSLMVGLVVGAVAATGVGAIAGYQILREPAFAQVVDVTPIMKTVRTPRQECHDEQVTQQAPTRDPHRITGSVVGAVVGGVLGNQVGGGDGKQIAKIAGAAAGGYAGNRIQKKMQDRNTVTTTQQRCETVYDSHQERIGFDVRYRLGDEEGKVRMDRDPGERIPVRDGKLDLTAPEPGGTEG
jgi:uncharacterized protein YcfJ